MNTKTLIIILLVGIGAYLIGFTQGNQQIITKQASSLLTVTPKATPTPTKDSFVQSVDNLLSSVPPTLTISPTLQHSVSSSYRQTFMRICGSDKTYCTCLYNVMSQNYSDVDIQNEIYTKGKNVLSSGYGSNGQESPMVLNALSECNNRFNSK
jgi:hypothetical protein